MSEAACGCARNLCGSPVNPLQRWVFVVRGVVLSGFVRNMRLVRRCQCIATCAETESSGTLP